MADRLAIDASAPVIGTNTNNGLIYLSWKSGSGVSNVFWNSDEVLTGTEVLLLRHDNAGITNTITFEHDVHGYQEMVISIENNQREISAVFSIIAPAPAVTGVDSNTSTLAGSPATPLIEITGANFKAASHVKFGGVDATSFTFVNNTTITARAPPATSAGAVSVEVTTPSATNPPNTLFTYTAPVPTVTSISPESGPLTAGTPVTINGEHFTAASEVKIGGVAATSLAVFSDTEITAFAPMGSAGKANVEVTAPGGTGLGSDLFTYLNIPTVTGITDNSGPLAGGFTAIITGTNFTAGSTVKIGGVAATVTNVTGTTQLSVTVPSGTAGAADVEVTTPGGVATGAGLFTYLDASTISMVAPNSGPLAGLAEFIIKGANFTTGATVTIGGNNAPVTSSDPTELKVSAPASATAGAADVVVTTPGGVATGTGLFTYRGLPTITKVDPNTGPVAGGTSVVITGSEFTDVTSVKFGGVDATSFIFDSDTQITAVTPPGSVGSASVEITTTFGTNAANTLFTYTASIEETQRVIASFLQNRALNLLNIRPDITQFISGHTAGGPLGNLQLNANEQGFNLAFASSLTHIMNAANASLTSDEQTIFGYGSGGGSGEGSGGGDGRRDQDQTGARAQDYDLWVQIHGAHTQTDEEKSTLWVGQFGGHAFINTNTLIGTMVQFDWADQSQRGTPGTVEGFGWMVGPYFAARLPDQSLTLDAFATWGRSDNNVSPDGTYTDEFETERWMINAQLSGVFAANGWTIRPAIEVNYFKETQFSYVDSLNSTIPEQSLSMGEMRFGPSISRQWVLDDGTEVQPTIGVSGVWNFAVDKSGLFPAAGLSSNDLRARIEAGLTVSRRDEWALDVAGFYDGIGANNLESFGGKLRLIIPLP